MRLLWVLFVVKFLEAVDKVLRSSARATRSHILTYSSARFPTAVDSLLPQDLSRS